MAPCLVDHNDDQYDEESSLNMRGGSRGKSYKVKDEMWFEPGAFEVQEKSKQCTESRYLESDATDLLAISD